MPFELDKNDALYQINAFQPGHLRINGIDYNQSVIISAQKLIENWAPQSLQELTLENLALAAELKPDILLIGTGSTLIFPALEIYGPYINAGMGIEIMDTAAACRTYNALSAENRNVVAALIIR